MIELNLKMTADDEFRDGNGYVDSFIHCVIILKYNLIQVYIVFRICKHMMQPEDQDVWNEYVESRLARK